MASPESAGGAPKTSIFELVKMQRPRLRTIVGTSSVPKAVGQLKNDRSLAGYMRIQKRLRKSDSGTFK